jgi:hypothetical protein
VSPSGKAAGAAAVVVVVVAGAVVVGLTTVDVGGVTGMVDGGRDEVGGGGE